MLNECAFIIPFYNRINNLTYNVNFCLKHKLNLLLLIDYPKLDKYFSRNLKIYKRACLIVRQFRLKNVIIADKNRGKVLFAADESLKFLACKYFKYVIMLEDDHLLTNKFLCFVKTVINKNDFLIALGRGQPNVNNNNYTKSLISLPAGSHIYNYDYIVKALTAQLHINKSYLPDFLNNELKESLYKKLARLYPAEYTKYKVTTNHTLEMYSLSSELKIFFYNLINRIYIYVPLQNLTPYNPTDKKEAITLLTKNLNENCEFIFEDLSQKIEINKFTQLNNSIK
jgi:hypothetical protein